VTFLKKPTAKLFTYSLWSEARGINSAKLGGQDATNLQFVVGARPAKLNWLKKGAWEDEF
jgi:hypothetical protein